MARAKLVSPARVGSKQQPGVSVRRDPAPSPHRPRELTPEFCALIYDADSGASNDDYYVTSADFLELHSGIRRGLFLGLLTWGIGVLAAVGILGFVYG